MNGIARMVKALENFTGNAALYEMSPPMDGVHQYVAVSATSVFGTLETYLFPADSGGNVTDWGELNGSQSGTLSHAAALADAGYQIAAKAAP